LVSQFPGELLAELVVLLLQPGELRPEIVGHLAERVALVRWGLRSAAGRSPAAQARVISSRRLIEKAEG
jgi:hypothetical protein